MLITKTYHDVPSKLDSNGRPIRVFIIAPNVPNYPHAKFPGIVVFSEIYQVTGPVERFAGKIASHGYVHALPAFMNLKAQTPSRTDRGNKYKIEKEVTAYDEAWTPALHFFSGTRSELCCRMQLLPLTFFALFRTATVASPLRECVSGGISSVSTMIFTAISTSLTCPNSHLILKAFRAAFDTRVLSSVCFFATDIHSATLGKGKKDNSLARVRAGALSGRGELVDTHVPRAGRDLIRQALEDANVTASFLEVQAQHAFIRDESSKGRWDAALTRSLFSFLLEVFERTVGRDLGPRVGNDQEVEHVC
ncbi:hypothetical protein EW146_g3948 [Bondarzewia mesenterica]|uniref:Dienelactone hydrolase domain-containing protein n=1 Tax=Bondarzewia mesenterica TaxID=1095465 RepID=A0A4S4LX31_9AGAM|nr:hypothetical protein EW146_g3948 [Bondarzewia mesenterica]